MMSIDMTPDDFEWVPPSAAEMKVIQARRERSDKISQLMGEYLLKGYKMLGIVCDICETILLETTSGEKYCIACKELDEDAEKDNPVFQADNSQPKAEEQRHKRSDAISKLLGDYLLKGYKMLDSTCSECDTILLQDRSKNYMCVGCEFIDKKPDQDQLPVLTSTAKTSNDHRETPPNTQDMTKPTVTSHRSGTQPTVATQCSTTQDVLQLKIEWATEKLRTSSSVDYSIQLCSLIKTAADAISSLQTISKH